MARAPMALAQGPTMLRLGAAFGLLCIALSASGAAGEEKRDYYEVLEIDKEADARAIKQAYRKQALRWHPDRNPDDRENAEKIFREVAEAYEVLSKEDSRKRYDTYGHDTGHAGGRGGGGGGGFGGFGFGFADEYDLFIHMFGTPDPYADFSQFFAEDFETGQGTSNETAQAFEELVSAMSTFYQTIGQPDKAPEEKVRELLKHPKWAGKEEKMSHYFKKKYPEPEYADALQPLQAAFSKVAETRGPGDVGEIGKSGGDYDPFGWKDHSTFKSGSAGMVFQMKMSGLGTKHIETEAVYYTPEGGGKTTHESTFYEGARRVKKQVERDQFSSKATLEKADPDGFVQKKTTMKSNVLLSDQQEL